MWPFKPKPNKVTPNLFKGVDLNVYDFLGTSEASYVNDDGKPLKSMSLYFFSKKGNPKDRKLYKNDTSIHKYDSLHTHPFVREAEIWAIGEGELYTYVNNPSEFLQQWMSSTRGYNWDGKRWTYDSPQPGMKTKPTQNNEGNLVRVDFSKNRDQ